MSSNFFAEDRAITFFWKKETFLLQNFQVREKGRVVKRWAASEETKEVQFVSLLEMSWKEKEEEVKNSFH